MDIHCTVISCHADAELSEKIRDALVAEDIRPVFVMENVDAEEDRVPERIRRLVDESLFVLIAITDESERFASLRAVIKYAFSTKKMLLPYKTHRRKLSFGLQLMLGQTHWLDVSTFEDPDEGIEELRRVAAIHRKNFVEAEEKKLKEKFRRAAFALAGTLAFVALAVFLPPLLSPTEAPEPTPPEQTPASVPEKQPAPRLPAASAPTKPPENTFSLIGRLYSLKCADLSLGARRNVLAETLRELERNRFSSEWADKNFPRAPTESGTTLVNMILNPHSGTMLTPADWANGFAPTGNPLPTPGVLALYTGWFSPAETGTYRFVGIGDDAMLVGLDGETVLFAYWPKEGTGRAIECRSDWFPPNHCGEKGNDGATAPAMRLADRSVYRFEGSRMRLEKGKTYRVSIAIADAGGGGMGGILGVVQEGKSREDGKIPLFRVGSAADVPEFIRSAVEREGYFTLEGPEFFERAPTAETAETVPAANAPAETVPAKTIPAEITPAEPSPERPSEPETPTVPEKFSWTKFFPNGLVSGNESISKANSWEHNFSGKCVLVYRRFGLDAKGRQREMQLRGRFSREMTPQIVPVADPATGENGKNTRNAYGFSLPWTNRGLLKKSFGNADFALLDEDGALLLSGEYTMTCFSEIEAAARERLEREEREARIAAERHAEQLAAEEEKRVNAIDWKKGLLTAEKIRESFLRNSEIEKDGKEKLMQAYPHLRTNPPEWFRNANDAECGQLLSSRTASAFSSPIEPELVTDLSEKKRLLEYLEKTEDFHALPEIWQELVIRNVENFHVRKNRGYTYFSNSGRTSFDKAIKNGDKIIISRNKGTVASIDSVTWFSSSALEICKYAGSKKISARQSNAEHLLGWICPPRKRPMPRRFVALPESETASLSEDERRYVAKLIEVVNENLDFLGNTPLPQFAENEVFWGKAFVSFGLMRRSADAHRAFYDAKLVPDSELVKIIAGGDKEKFEIQNRLGFPIYDPEKSVARGSRLGDWRSATAILVQIENGPLAVVFPHYRWTEFPLSTYLASTKKSLQNFREQLNAEASRFPAESPLRRVVESVAEIAAEHTDEIEKALENPRPGEPLLER